MKKITFLLAATLGLVSFAAQAQATGTTTPTDPAPVVDKKTAQATVNVRLHPIQTIMVNSGQTVNLDYKTELDYAKGVNTTQADHLTVYSTGAFAVTVQSDNEKLTSSDSRVKSDINASDIWVTASKGSNTIAEAKFEDPVSLSKSAKPLFSSSVGGVHKNFNVNYKAMGDADKYVNKYFSVQDPTVYSTTVTYSIVAK